MCGICGIYRSDEGVIDPNRVLRIRDSMIFRGPDACGMTASPGCALGHRRLSIIDLSDAGSQPMASADGSVKIVFNGEIYNFLELRPELENAGHCFRSRTDTEVLIYGYQTWGLDGLLRRIRGMYAFALYDSRRHEIHLARDPLGKKPLYYRWAGGELAFASSARALVLGLACTPEIDHAAIDDLLWNRAIGGSRTIFQGVEKLLPGHAWSLGRDAKPRELVHWRPNFFEHDAGIDADDWLERIDVVVKAAVKRRLVADVPIGVLLSGGVDSGMVAALAAGCVGRIKTYCVASEDPRIDESAYAQAIAERYGTEHHLLPVRSDVRADLPQLAAAMGEPFADVSAANLFAIARLAKQSVTVVLTGDGGDEGFGGYTEFFAAHYAQMAHRALPVAARRPLAKCAQLLQLGPRLSRRAGTFLRIGALPLEQSFGELHPAEARRRATLYTRDFLASLGEHQPRGRVFQLLASNSDAAWCDRVMQAHLLTVLPDDFLPKVDLATMGASLEARCPFLDLDVMELAMRIPSDVRLHQRRPKGLLRRLARRYLPKAGVDRRKQGFTAPLGMWFRRDWNDLVADFILGPQVERRGWFRREALEQLVREHARGREHGNLLWALLVLEVWMRLAVDRTLTSQDAI